MRSVRDMVRNEEIPQMGDFAMAVAAVIRDAAASANVSGSELARRLGRAQSYASLRLNGRKAWTLDELDAVSRIIGVPIDRLIDQARR